MASEPEAPPSASPSAAIEKPSTGDWRMEIIPGPIMTRAPSVRAKSVPVPPGKMALPPVPEESHSVNAVDYAEIYRSIPFSRAEYLANPHYRHEATMEILFGQLRPTTVVRLPGLNQTRSTYSQHFLGRPGDVNYSTWSPRPIGHWHW